MDGGASAGAARQLPSTIVKVLRTLNGALDYTLSLLESGQATFFLPPYED